MPTADVSWRGRMRRLWVHCKDLARRPRLRGQPFPAPRDSSDPAGRWEAPADARAQLAGQLAAAGTRLRAEDDRLQAERAYGVVDLGAQERLSGQARAHRAALRRFRAAGPGARAGAP